MTTERILRDRYADLLKEDGEVLLPLVSQLDELLGPGDVPGALVAAIRARATTAKEVSPMAASPMASGPRKPTSSLRSRVMWRRSEDADADSPKRRSGSRRGTMLATVAAAVAFVIVSVAVLGLVRLATPGRSSSYGGSGQRVAAGPPIDWDSGDVHLTADSLRIVTPSHTFTGIGITRRAPVNSFACVTTGACIDIHSGRSSKSATLEMQWMEAGVAMKLNLYFTIGTAKWWVTEIRTYDGRKSGDWLEWQGHWFETPVGGTWSGDLDLSNGQGNYHRSDGLTPTGDLYISGMRLSVNP